MTGVLTRRGDVVAVAYKKKDNVKMGGKHLPF